MEHQEEIKDNLGSAAVFAAKQLRAFFEDPDNDPASVITARIAQGVVSSWVKLHQVEKTQEATLFVMARELAKNPDELQAYINRALPSSPFAKVLEAPKNKKP